MQRKIGSSQREVFLRRHLGQFGRILCVLTSVLKSVLKSVLSFLVTSHPGV